VTLSCIPQSIEFLLRPIVTTTLAPSSRNARLTARPNPPVPPATNATFPENLALISFLLYALAIRVDADPLALPIEQRADQIERQRKYDCR
jgi:hypothetical protein